MKTFLEAFNAYGADYADTMERFMHSEQMYLKLLDMFMQDKSINLLNEALRAGDLKAAFEAAHTLKGVCANMGLTPLYQAVCAIVAPLRARAKRDDYAVLFQAIQTEYHKVEDLRKELIGAVM